MIPPSMRPKFVIQTAIAPEIVLQNMDKVLSDPKQCIYGRVLSRHMCMTVPKEEQHFWSPSLDVDVVPNPDGKGCELRGYFGPLPNVWTMFLAMYAVLILVSGAGVLIAFSQWILGNTPTALLALPLCLILAIILYMAAVSGQKISAPQIDKIRDFVYRQIVSAENNHRADKQH